MSFAQAVSNQTTVTENGMTTNVTSSSKLVDLFFNIGASRKLDIVPLFVGAYTENKDIAARIALYARDVRGGMGERKVFFDIVTWLIKADIELATKLVKKLPTVGRWKDLLVFLNTALESVVLEMIKNALDEGNGLCAKWMPVQGSDSYKIRKYMGFNTPKSWRKHIVSMRDVVETKMCGKDWDSINYEHVPSVAMARYNNAFYRNSTTYPAYVESVKKGEAKINSGAVYPHDVVKLLNKCNSLSQTEVDVIVEQWKSLEDFIGNKKILPVCDVSGSMTAKIGGGSTTCKDVSIALGLYISDKMSGEFKDLIMTFSEKPTLMKLTGNIFEKYSQLDKADWGYSTDICAMYARLLEVAKDGNVAQEDMPEYLVILSDMQFDQADDVYNLSAHKAAKEYYSKAGYKLPNIIYWNLNSKGGSPVKFDDTGTALISGFSPSVMKCVLQADFESITPYRIVLDAVMSDRYLI